MKTNNTPEASVNQEAVNEFQNLLKNNGFPHFKTGGYFAMGSPSISVWNHAEIKFPVRNGVHKGSQYYLSRGFEFLHFTNIQAAFNIIKEKKIRLYSLESMSDPHELRSLEHLYQDKSDYHLSTIKSQMFCLSMCDLKLEKEKQSLSAWREYGNDGKGVALLLKFNSKYKDEWLNYLVSRVFYSEKDRQKVEKITGKYLEFRSKFNVTNFDHFIYRFSCFHKAPIYQDEREVRLVFFNELKESASFTDKKSVFQDLDSNANIREYRELKLEDIPDKKFLQQFPSAVKLFPYVTIEKVIFGHSMTKDQKWNFVDAVKPFVKNYSKGKFTFEDSTITNYFN